MAFMTAASAPVVPASPVPLTPRGLVVQRHGMRRRFEHRQVVGARHRVVHERSREQLAGLAFEDRFLPQRLADALGDAAMDLSLDEHGIEHVSAIVDGGVGARGRPLRCPDRSRPRRCGSHSGRSAGRSAWPLVSSDSFSVPGAPGHLEQGHAAVGTGDAKRAIAAYSMSASAVSSSCEASLRPFSIDQLDRAHERAAGGRGRARGDRRAARDVEVGVALMHDDAGLGDAEPRGGEPAIERGVALSRRMHAERHDQRVVAGKANAGFIARHAARHARGSRKCRGRAVCRRRPDCARRCAKPA